MIQTYVEKLISQNLFFIIFLFSTSEEFQSYFLQECEAQVESTKLIFEIEGTPIKKKIIYDKQQLTIVFPE